MNNEKIYRPVKQLPPNVARKIAAGEVIDRPNAVLREFLDNAVDAHANRVIVDLEGGGTDLVRVADNGWGMDYDDLVACAHPHATSKITTEDDLTELSTLGFRGEALASIAAVSHLEIKTARNKTAWYMEAALNGKHHIEQTSLNEGTIVSAQGLFENFPARRQFLKRPQTEGSLCKQTFIEKAMPFYSIAFRLHMDGKLKIDLPTHNSLKNRFLAALNLQDTESLFYEITTPQAEHPSFSATIIIGEASMYRNDRKQMYIFVNGRRIQEYGLLQAMDYGCEGFFPNAAHPIGAVFITIDPTLVDFNIHPAKREVRFKDIGPIHHAISSTIKSFLRGMSIKNTFDNTNSDTPLYRPDNENFYAREPQQQYNRTSSVQNTQSVSQKTFLFEQKPQKEYDPYRSAAHFSQPHSAPIMSSHFKQDIKKTTIQENTEHDDFLYIGQIFQVFLIAEKNETIYLVDQHAAHERILFNQFLENEGKKQGLLVPLVIESPSNDDDIYLESLVPAMNKAGFDIENKGDGRWEVSAIPTKWQGDEKDLQEALLTKRIKPDELIHALAAQTSCKAAIKTGHVLDSESAKKLLKDTFNLPDPHCPHGRPVWTIITKETLFKAVRRID